MKWLKNSGKEGICHQPTGNGILVMSIPGIHLSQPKESLLLQHLHHCSSYQLLPFISLYIHTTANCYTCNPQRADMKINDNNYSTLTFMHLQHNNIRTPTLHTISQLINMQKLKESPSIIPSKLEWNTKGDYTKYHVMSCVVQPTTHIIQVQMLYHTFRSLDRWTIQDRTTKSHPPQTHYMAEVRN